MRRLFSSQPERDMKCSQSSKLGEKCLDEMVSLLDVSQNVTTPELRRSGIEDFFRNLIRWTHYPNVSVSYDIDLLHQQRNDARRKLQSCYFDCFEYFWAGERAGDKIFEFMSPALKAVYHFKVACDSDLCLEIADNVSSQNFSELGEIRTSRFTTSQFADFGVAVIGIVFSGMLLVLSVLFAVYMATKGLLRKEAIWAWLVVFFVFLFNAFELAYYISLAQVVPYLDAEYPLHLVWLRFPLYTFLNIALIAPRFHSFFFFCSI
jgi:hypothetical protein